MNYLWRICRFVSFLWIICKLWVGEVVMDYVYYRYLLIDIWLILLVEYWLICLLSIGWFVIESWLICWLKYWLIFGWYVVDVSVDVSIELLIGISIDISIDVWLCVGRYSVDMLVDIWLVYRLIFGRCFDRRYIGLLSVVYRSIGGGILFLLIFFILMLVILVEKIWLFYWLFIFGIKMRKFLELRRVN